jgi:excisionase family DNA binding protein
VRVGNPPSAAPALVPAAPADSSPPARAASLVGDLRALLPDLPADELRALRVRLFEVGDEALLLVAGAAPAGEPTGRRRPEAPDADLTLAEAAAYLRFSEGWLYHRWKRLRLGYRSGRKVLFRRADLDRWREAQRRRRL